MFHVNPLPRQRIHIKYQVLSSLKNNEKVFINVVCCSRDCTLWPHQKTLGVLKYETHTDNFSAAGFHSFELSIDYSLYLKTSDCS